MAEGKRTVLVVDDDDDFRELLVTICKDNGADAVGVTDGEELLKLMDARKHFDIILLDIMMKKMNGLEALKKLRSLNHIGAYTPVHMITGYGDQRLIAMAGKFGVSGFTIKPLQEEVLWSSLEREMLPHITADQVRECARSLHIQDPKVYEELRDPGINFQDYRCFPSQLDNRTVAILLRNPLMVRQVAELSDAQLVETVRVYSYTKAHTQLVWPQLRTFAHQPTKEKAQKSLKPEAETKKQTARPQLRRTRRASLPSRGNSPKRSA